MNRGILADILKNGMDSNVEDRAVVIPPEPLVSVVGYSPSKSLVEHGGWPNVHEREPVEREVRELARKLMRLATWAASVLRDVGEGGEGVAALVDALDPVFCRAEDALAQRRWEAGVAHMRHLEMLLRLVTNWGSSEGEYHDTGGRVVLEGHWERYMDVTAETPAVGGPNWCAPTKVCEMMVLRLPLGGSTVAP